MAPTTVKSKIDVGQIVMLSIGKNRLRGTVIEDRGNLGLHGERILRVAFEQGEDVPPTEHEVPEAELEPDE